MLYDTFGFPIDLTMLLAEERGFSVASDEFNVLLDAQKHRSRMVTRKRLAGAIDTSADGIQNTVLPGGAHSVFVGYDVTEVETRINTIVETESSCIVVLDETPFYAESGGQASDTGVLMIGSDECPVRGLLKRDGITLHVMDPDWCGRLREGDTVKARVDDARRRAIMRNHTATHLAHAALRSVLGTHVQQAGSAVDEHHLRFDFSHYARVEPDQIREMEDMVNTVILEGRPVTQHRGISFDTARRMNALMFFGDKYGDFVNVIEVEGFSKEFCGGTHVGNTADIGLFKIISEGSVASGTRRIEAVTGMGVSRHIDSLIEKIGERNARETELLDRIKHLEKELTKKALENADSEIDTLVHKALSVDGLRVVASRIEAESGDQLKNLGDKLREKIGSGVGVLAAVLDEKVSLVCVVTDDLIKQRGLKAGSIVGVLAKRLGGGGGGRPHLATAGGREVGKLDAALADIAAIIDEAGRG
jgi:alanyl-tRNA synthetase